MARSTILKEEALQFALTLGQFEFTCSDGRQTACATGWNPIVEKMMGTEDQRRANAVKRLDIHEILGTKIMRQITLK
jgi:hypothetical protein